MQRQLFLGLGDEMKVTLAEELEKETARIGRVERNHVLGQRNEGQAVRFCLADQLCLDSLGVQS